MYLIRKLLQGCVLKVLYCRTHDQVVDILTKALTEVKFSKLISILEIQEVFGDHNN